MTITGNILTRSDPRKLVAEIWPSLEAVLDKEGFKFRDDNVDQWIHQIGKYRGATLLNNAEIKWDVRDEERKEKFRKVREDAVNDLLTSRPTFISNIDRFRLDESSTYVLGIETMSTCNVSIGLLNLEYINEESKKFVYLTLFPRYYSQYANTTVGGNNHRRNKRVYAKGPDANEIVVKIQSNSKHLEKQIRREYREQRRKVK